MQSAYLRNDEYSAAFERFDISRDRRVPVEGQMRPRFVIVVQVTGEDPLQVSFSQDDDVIEALSVNRAYQSLDERRLPRIAIRDDDFFNAHVLDTLAEGEASPA